MWKALTVLGGAGALTWWALRGPKTFRAPPTGFWYKAVEQFGGRPIDPQFYPPTLIGLDRYLSDARVRSPFTANEIAAPNHPNIALDLGYRNFLPVRENWPKVAALMGLSRQIRDVTQESFDLRNLWRPEDYNARVDGAPGSAHIEAAAVDLDFETEDDATRAELLATALQRREPWMKVGIGIGRKTLHVDLLTDKPQRPNTWRY